MRPLIRLVLAALILGVGWARPAGAQDPRLGLRTALGMFAPVRNLVAVRSAAELDVALEPAVQVRGELDLRLSGGITLYAGADYIWTRMQHSTALQLGLPKRDYSGVSLFVPTAGFLVGVPGFGGAVRPTLRLGGGFKFYQFDVAELPGRLRDPTLDLGFGFTASGPGQIKVIAEGRWLGSEFQHASLPLKARTTTTQVLADWVLQLGVRFGI